MTYVRPGFVSEREVAHTWPDGQPDDAAWEDCVWCSGLMAANARDGNAHPATHYEAERIRQAAGKPASEKGSTLTELNTGLKARYGYALPTSSGAAINWTKLVPGTAAVAFGVMGNFPAGHRLRRHQPGYTGGHAVYIAREDANARVWWMDPLGPKTGYSGEWVTQPELALFQQGNATIGYAPLAIAPEVSDMPVPTGPQLVDTRASVQAKRNIRVAPSLTAKVIRLTSAVEVWAPVCWVKGDVDDGSDLWLCRIFNGQWEYTTKSNLAAQPVVPPDTTPYSKADLDAAKVSGAQEREAAWETWVATHP